MTKLDQLGRSARDLGEIAQKIQLQGIAHSLGRKLLDQPVPRDKLFFGRLVLFAEFRGDLVSARTNEALDVSEFREK